MGITIEMLTSALGSCAGLSALVVILTQVLKRAINKDNKKWLNHLLSFISSLFLGAIVLGIGLLWGNGFLAAFNVHCWTHWLLWSGMVLGCTGVANGLWTYDAVQQVLKWLHLISKPKKMINE